MQPAHKKRRPPTGCARLSTDFFNSVLWHLTCLFALPMSPLRIWPRTFGRRASQGPHGGQWLRWLRRDPRRAIHEEEILCLICGGPFRQLTNTHLRSHDLTALAYKQRFGYNRRRPLMCVDLRRLYIERAIRRGLAALIRHRPILCEPDLRRRAGFRPMTLEESLTRRDAWRRRKAAAFTKRNGRVTFRREMGGDRAKDEAVRAQTA